MTSIYQAFGLKSHDLADLWRDEAASKPGELTEAAGVELNAMTEIGKIWARAAQRNADRIAGTHSERAEKTLHGLRGVFDQMAKAAQSGQLWRDWQAYLRDSAERGVLTADTLRRRGDVFLAHEAAGCPPVLSYDYEVILEGSDLVHPSNYQLLQILPPEGCEVMPWKRPYIIIDPRAGHGGGIGGFKTDSQVGVALRDGHPVYFVNFKRMPEPGQTLADVTRSEAEFVREVMRRHPKSPKPVITGNCQGGWASLLLAATNPDLTGPVVLNGAPVSTWAGEAGINPMRYNGGVLGGAWIPMLLADLGNGVFDGAHLVQNFEMLNPSRSFFRKYYDLYAKADTEADRFVEFETWWGGFFLLNEAEIRWIVSELFVGNKLVKNQAQLEPGRPIDIKNIQSPIIVFTSWGDNITPPQQALNWILDTYPDESEIEIRGQRIVYMVHDQVGHLGIFVSSKIAQKEHTEVASTLKTIESLAPGLYEMVIDDYRGDVLDRTFQVSFRARKLDDIRALDDGRADERPFAAVARASEIQASAYELFLRPWVRAMASDTGAEFARMMHPLRLQRALWSGRNPLAATVTAAAARAREARQPAAPDNLFLGAERVMADWIEQSLDLSRDMRDMMFELAFYGMWGTPWARWFGKAHEAGRTLKDQAELRALPAVQTALMHIGQGGFVEAVVRMLILLAGSRGTVRRDRLERSTRVMTLDEPFCNIDAPIRARIIHEQTIIAHFEPARAIETLPELLEIPEERALAGEVVRFIVGPIGEMDPHSFDLLQRFHVALDLPPITGDIPDDPLAPARPEREPSKSGEPAE
jgi:pimeloyl-ACP methyl ester carboxylesterase